MLRLLGVGGNKKEATQDGTTDPANEASEPPAAAAAVGQTPAAVEPALPSKAPGLADVRTEPGHAARQRLVDRIEALVHADLVPPLLPVTKPELLPSKATLGLAFAWKDTDYIITRVLIGGPAFLSHKISEGDALLGVNDVPLAASHGKIDDAQIVQLLLGDDTPGSQCRVEFRSAATGIEETVVLTRMCNDLLAHKRQFFGVQEKLHNHLQA